jgi:hypothetical protein
MMKALTTYALAAALYATAPTGQGHDSAKAGGSDADVAAASTNDQAGGPDSKGGDQSGDPSPAHVQGRRPEPRSDSASQRMPSSARKSGTTAPPDGELSDEGRRQQESWTGP